MLSLPSLLVGRAARLRRRAALSARRRVLAQPVVSVGNLSVGGTGKTPVAAALARLLADAGHRPSILSRGYARERFEDGVVVVSDGHGIRADVERAGDEPFMLARDIPGCAVLVSANRYAAGRLAEWQFGCTVHLLDDGFQHLALARTVDLLLLDPEDLAAPRVLPAGRLREPLSAASHADALLVGDGPDLARVSELLNVADVFRLVRQDGGFEPAGPDAWRGAPPSRVVAVAGIARPTRFFAGLLAAGCDVAAELAFRDHHPYRAADIERIREAVVRTAADGVVTTAKDLVRLLRWRPWPFRLAVRRLEVSVEPADAFASWLLARVPPPLSAGAPA